MGFKYNNPHPQGKLVNDCVKRAITIATGKGYTEIQKELNRLKKVTGCEKFNDNRNYKYYLEKILRCKKLSFPAQAGFSRMNGERFCQEYPSGKYILRMAGHLSCCVDGVINDTWDCSEKCVYNAWQIH